MLCYQISSYLLLFFWFLYCCFEKISSSSARFHNKTFVFFFWFKYYSLPLRFEPKISHLRRWVPTELLIATNLCLYFHIIVFDLSIITLNKNCLSMNHAQCVPCGKHNVHSLSSKSSHGFIELLVLLATWFCS